MRKQPYDFKRMCSARELISDQNPEQNAWVKLLEGTWRIKWSLHSKKTQPKNKKKPKTKIQNTIPIDE